MHFGHWMKKMKFQSQRAHQQEALLAKHHFQAKHLAARHRAEAYQD
jgi:hypothetical protein